MNDSINKNFAYKPRDPVQDDPTDRTVTEGIIDAYRRGSIPSVRQPTDAAYEQLLKAWLLAAQMSRIRHKPASWGRQDRLTFFVVVISLEIKVSVYLANKSVGVQLLTPVRRLSPSPWNRTAEDNADPRTLGGRGSVVCAALGWKDCRSGHVSPSTQTEEDSTYPLSLGCGRVSGGCPFLG